MSLNQIGIATHHARVEAWECDYNHHWNARYYFRNFQLASERVVTLDGLANPGAASVVTRTVRFHRELFIGAAVEVRSARISTGQFAGSIVHAMLSEGLVSATALDRPRLPGVGLPAVDAAEVELALPRAAPSDMPWDSLAADASVCETGTVRPHELDHTGSLLFEEMIRRMSVGVHDQLAMLGFTTEFMKATSISRMTVELTVTPLGICAAGTPLRVRSRISSVRSKSFSSIHWLETPDGSPISQVENTIVAVDLTSRRAVELPDFLLRLKD